MYYDNIFVNIIDNMTSGGYFNENEAANLKIKYKCYVNDLMQANKRRSMSTQNAVKTQSSNQVSLNNTDNQPKQTAKQAIKQPAKQLTKEQIRERNLSWKLNIGIILLLISGLIFATTTWSLFNNIVKVFLLFCVSLFFFGISIFSKNVLKIVKSSNAFWIIGSLFLPLSLLSIGFFKLLGTHLSIFGNGRFIYGVLCTIICIPIFIFSTYKFKSRIFSWLTLSTISLLFAFVVSSFYPPHLVLIFMLFIFNAALLFAKQKITPGNISELFFKELGIFIQINLLITLIMTIFSYSTDTLYSINILLLSFIVFALSTTEDQSIYDYLSAFIFCIGIYLLASSTNNYSIKLILIASIGIIFSGVTFIYKNDTNRYKRYSMLSIITTALSFIYIANFNRSLMYEENIIIYTCMACLIVLTLNYLKFYLKDNLNIVGFFIPLQIFTLIYYILHIFDTFIVFSYKLEYLTIMTLLFFIFSYALNNSKHLKEFAISSAACSLLSTFIIFVWCFFQKAILVSLPIIAFVFASQIFVLWLKTVNKDIKQFLSYFLPILIFSSLCLTRYSYNLNFIPSYIFYFACALIIYCIHFIMIRKLSMLEDSFFYCGHILLAMLFLSILSSNQPLQFQTISILIMCIIYSYSIYHHRKNKISYIWLNALLITFTILLYNGAHIINSYAKLNFYRYVLYVNGFLLMLVLNFIKDKGYKKNIAIYLTLLTIILSAGNMVSPNILWYEYLSELIFCALLCVILTKLDFHVILFVPLLLYITASHILIQHVLNSSLISIAIIVVNAVILSIAGQLNFKLLFSKKNIDFYSLAALISIFLLPYHYNSISIEAVGIVIPGILGSLWFLANSRRLFADDSRPGFILFALSLLWPFYSLISAIDIPNSIIYEVYLLPLVLLTYVCIKWIYKDKYLKPIEYIIPIICYVILIVHLIASDSIMEAIILSGFGVISIFYGSIFKTKSSLFTGGVLVILSVLIKSRDFWFSISWWIYLAVIGGTLVITASINEYEKNKNSKGIFQNVRKLLEKFSSWD